jgi:hypothetical protein
MVIDRNPSASKLRLFGGLWLPLFLLVVAFLLDRRGHAAALTWTLAAVAALSAAIGWMRPAWMRPVFVSMSIVFYPVGLVVSHVVLALVYFLIFTPLALCMRLAGRDELRLQIDRDAPTYWSERDQETDPARYLRQF